MRPWAKIASVIGLVAIEGCVATVADVEQGASDIATLEYCRMDCGGGLVTSVSWNGVGFVVAAQAVINGNTAVADFGIADHLIGDPAALVQRHVFDVDSSDAVKGARMTALRTKLGAVRTASGKPACTEWHITSFGNPEMGNQIYGFTCADDISGECFTGWDDPSEELACPQPNNTARAYCVVQHTVNIGPSVGTITGYSTCGANVIKWSEADGYARVTPAVGDLNSLQTYPSARTLTNGTYFYVPSDELACSNYLPDGTNPGLQAFFAQQDDFLDATCHGYGVPSLSAIPEAPTKAAAIQGGAYRGAPDLFSEAYLNQRSNAFEFWGKTTRAGTYYCNSWRADGRTTVNVWTQAFLNPGQPFWCAYYAPGASFVVGAD